ncbi:hypothetical protein [Myceligenerans pegani]|uniref:Integral membrane protein n=1 Tax=Myceligenerans pegani TaxID=2776917 RepID=A0ABR9N506_9MICO|nr:hypothetical protein [Myceligenerans sp. TRM 65318]MBE1878745.1 hypothetical protein [Myceligenerans sp. TRM 65318]MBE3021016.1 hypothetical protein [Myceligenerans sp. TRM 65318]
MSRTTTPTTAARRAARRAARTRDTESRGAFGLFAETLLVGVLVIAASVPVVTLPAALAAGVAHLRRYLAGLPASGRTFVRDWLAAVRDLWGLGLMVLALAAVLAANVRVAASGALPGGDAVVGATTAAGAIAAVILLRTAGAWSGPEGLTTCGSPTAASDGGRRAGADRATGSGGAGRDGGPGLRTPLRRAWAGTRDDLTGSALLLVALGLCGVLVWMLAPLVLVVGGLLSLAITAVESRHHTGSGAAGPAPST